MMLQRINYGDNIFFLTMLIRVLRDSEKLHVDPDLFDDKVRDDIRLAYESIKKITANLKESSLIKGRAEYFRDIYRLADQFTDLLTGVVDGKNSFSSFLESGVTEYRAIIHDLEHLQEEVNTVLAGISKEAKDGEYIISAEEYKILLSDEDEK